MYNENKKIEQEEKIVLTYLGAYWQRVNKLPSINEVLGKNKPKKEMTPEEMLEKIKQLNAAFGGEVIEQT